MKVAAIRKEQIEVELMPREAIESLITEWKKYIGFTNPNIRLEGGTEWGYMERQGHDTEFVKIRDASGEECNIALAFTVLKQVFQ